MATFDSTQITDIAVIFGVSSDAISNRLTLFASVISAEDKTKVLALLTEFEGIDNNYASFTPTESNEGFNLSADSNKDAIRERLGGLLHCEDFASMSGQRFVGTTMRG